MMKNHEIQLALKFQLGDNNLPAENRTKTAKVKSWNFILQYSLCDRK